MLKLPKMVIQLDVLFARAGKIFFKIFTFGFLRFAYLFLVIDMSIKVPQTGCEIVVGAYIHNIS